jgi:hypothetical protein
MNGDLRRRNRHAISLIRLVFEAALDVDAIADPSVFLGELRLKMPQRQPVPIGTLFLLGIGGLTAVRGE